jgi:hypothetical protein
MLLINHFINQRKNKNIDEKLNKLARYMNNAPCKTWKKHSKERKKCLTRKKKQKLKLKLKLKKNK